MHSIRTSVRVAGRRTIFQDMAADPDLLFPETPSITDFRKKLVFIILI
jgi:hypothetical protein